jgi:hypothetical protein
MPESSDEELLADLGIEVEPEKQVTRSPHEERVIAGFEEIQRFVEEHGRAPTHGNDKDIFERLYAVRLERLCGLEESETLLKPLDHQGLLTGVKTAAVPEELEQLDDAELLAQLGIESQGDDITELKHVRTSAEKRAAEQVARRQPCADFETFKPLFQKLQEELDNGDRETRVFELKAEIRPGSFFIVGGQKAYVAEMGEMLLTDQGRSDARLRVIFDNGTESSMLMRSLQRALNADDAGRRITESSAGPLFGAEAGDDDQASGIIYVLRSKSDHPIVAANREVVHKIGVTNVSVKQRIAGARLQPTFLMADVEVVATYELFNINRTKLENLLHRVFSVAQLDIEVKDRFGKPSVPREWFLVPLKAIDDAVERLKDGSLTKYVYDPEIAELKLRETDTVE